MPVYVGPVSVDIWRVERYLWLVFLPQRSCSLKYGVFQFAILVPLVGASQLFPESFSVKYPAFPFSTFLRIFHQYPP